MSSTNFIKNNNNNKYQLSSTKRTKHSRQNKKNITQFVIKPLTIKLYDGMLRWFIIDTILK
jgi:hypothetical protein